MASRRPHITFHEVARALWARPVVSFQGTKHSHHHTPNHMKCVLSYPSHACRLGRRIIHWDDSIGFRAVIERDESIRKT
jgi:hypothetical protein